MATAPPASPRPPADEAPPDLDARGVRLAPEDLNRVLAAAREDASFRLGRASLDWATVESDVSLAGATVKGVMYRPTPPREATGAPSYVVTTVPGPRPGWVTAFDYTVQSTTSLIRSPSSPPPLTGAGRILEIFLRFAGPGLLALAVLALRARVKR